MTRLSKNTRELMAAALTKHKMSARAEGLMAESRELFNAVLDAEYDAPTKKLMAQLVRRHPGSLTETDHLHITARGMYIDIGAVSFGPPGVRWRGKVENRLILRKSVNEPAEPLAGQIAQFGMDLKKFNEDARESYRRALGTLEQFTTAKGLTEGWPEAVPLVAALLPTEAQKLPVVQVAAINEEFGLPPAVERLAA